MPKLRVTLGVEEDFWKHENALWILSISLLFVKFQTIFLTNLGSGYCGLLVGNDRSIPLPFTRWKDREIRCIR